MLGNKAIAQVRTSGNSITIYYILSDHLNTPRKVANDAGTVLWSWDSDAFGSTIANEDVDGNGIDFEFNLRFPGQYFDKESLQHYNYFRDYESGTGRYLESDPIGLDGGINSFVYVSNKPTKFKDPNGLQGMFDGFCIFPGSGGCGFDDGLFNPPPAPSREKCESKCFWVSRLKCTPGSSGFGYQVATICSVTTGPETFGTSIPVCAIVGFITGQAVAYACTNHLEKECIDEKCCDEL